MGAAARVIRINRHTPDGRQAAQTLGVEAVPGFVVYDGAGAERLRLEGHLPDRKALVAALRQE